MKHLWKPKPVNMKLHNLHYAFTAMTKKMCGLGSLKRPTTNAHLPRLKSRMHKDKQSDENSEVPFGLANSLELCSCQSNSRNKYCILTDINYFFYSRECIFIAMKTI